MTKQTQLQFDAVSLVYADRTRALNQVSLSIPSGQFCVVLGPSGAGKSTLLRTVNGLAAPTGGAVYLSGHKVGSKSWLELRSRVAMIHQQFNLVGRLSVLKNVLTGALPAVPAWRAYAHCFGVAHMRKACALIERVGLGAEHLQRRVGELSGGQQQRVGIARAFMLDPMLVLADEPVASLDPATSREILALLHEAAKERGCTALCSLHQVDLARAFADRIVGMRAGEVVFDATPETLSEEAARKLYAFANPVNA